MVLTKAQSETVKQNDANPFGWVRKDRPKSRPRFALRFRIVIILLLVSMLPVVLLGIGSWIVFGRVLMERSMQLQHVAIERHAASIDLYLQERLRILETVARSHSLEEFSRPDTLPKVARVFNASYPNAFVDFGVINSKGEHIAYQGPYALKDRNYQKSGWFITTMSEGSYVSDIFLGYRKIPHLIIAIKRNEENRSWILRATINSGKFDSLVHTGRMGKSANIFIINSRGLYQTQSRRDQVLSRSSAPFLKPQLGVVDQELNVAGEKVVQSATWLNHNRWMLVVQQSKDEIMSALHEAVIWGFLVILIAVALVGTTTVLATSHLTNRIKRALQQRDELHRDLVRSAKLASLGELATGMAHEINNPLAILRVEQTNIADQIDDARLSDEVRQSLLKSTERCKRQIDRCGGITAKMLQFGRKRPTTPEVVDIRPIIQDTIGMLEKQAHIRNISIRIDVHEALPKLYLDTVELEQVLINLINNAFYAIDDQGLISVKAYQSGPVVKLEVEDNGKGIEKDNLEKVFLPFFTTKPIGEGTGMGLSVCYGIVRSWGGNLTVDSEIGKGTMFTIWLPIERAQMPVTTDVTKNHRLSEVAI